MVELRRRRRPVAAPPRTRSAETLKDLDHAIQELQRARDELVSVDGLRETNKHRLVALLQEPMSRIDLVRRFAAEVLRRHHWAPAELEA